MGTAKGEQSNERSTAELYERVWKRDAYSGFSRGTPGEVSTPLLDAFIAEVKALGVTPAPQVIELGAGSCVHSLRCAREGLKATAVEYSASAVADARRRLKEPGLDIVQADLFSFTQKLAPQSLGGAYANAVFHFLTADERREQYRRIRAALRDGGVLGISFKASGDALERRGPVVEQTLAGPVVKGDDGICRLFVSNADALMDEMKDEGFAVSRALRWSVPDYNLASEMGEFVGLLARRVS